LTFARSDKPTVAQLREKALKIEIGSKTVEIATNSGFCFGVKRAIELAEETLGRGGRVYSLGPVIHNPQEIARLEALGLLVIAEVGEAEDGVVIIRSHGINPETAEAARRKGLELVDATCPLVRRAQNLAGKLHEEGYSVAIVGDAAHPEVEAILGYAPGATVIAGPAEVGKVVSCPRLGVVSQTTQSPKEFREITSQMARQFEGHELRVFQTICNATVDRQSAALELAGRVEVMFVLGGRNSANTRQLASLCESAGVRTFHLERADELSPEMVAGRATIGVTAGASTPDWVVREFIERVKNLDAS
jgi:4-hydroxy-3-methylbut-2-enyl diphosphate reductase